MNWIKSGWRYNNNRCVICPNDCYRDCLFRKSSKIIGNPRSINLRNSLAFRERLGRYKCIVESISPTPGRRVDCDCAISCTCSTYNTPSLRSNGICITCRNRIRHHRCCNNGVAARITGSLYNCPDMICADTYNQRCIICSRNIDGKSLTIRSIIIIGGDQCKRFRGITCSRINCNIIGYKLISTANAIKIQRTVSANLTKIIRG